MGLLLPWKRYPSAQRIMGGRWWRVGKEKQTHAASALLKRTMVSLALAAIVHPDLLLIFP